MTPVERLEAAVVKLEALKAQSTPGEWVFGDRWSVAGVLPKTYGNDKCAYCESMGKPKWVGVRDINGKRMRAHVHERSEPWWDHGIYAAHQSGPICVINDTREYGYMESADADLIVALHRTIDAQLAILHAARDDLKQYGASPSKFFMNDLALADAILGGDPS